MPVKVKSAPEQKKEFLAFYLHGRYQDERTKEGYHYPDTHLNPFEVAPARRDDGRTFCDKCDLFHVPYVRLDEVNRQKFIKQVEVFNDALRAWDDSNT
jgi:hypothetical protein